ncbi:MAG: carbamoyltransferase [Bryobacteraceae bacterium]|nr:carbamoyltransferase [Bryobacteraceae bacterium]
MVIVGIGGILHDAACALLRDGDLVAAVEQRKVARRRRSGELPEESIAACLRMAGVSPEQVDYVAVVQPLAVGPEQALLLELRARFPSSQVVLVEHQMAHAASAYYPSGFDEATVLTLDRAGDFRCGARWRGAGNQLALEKELYYPDSLGDLYSRVTELLGFEPNADEHKVQWLSTFGDSRFRDVFLGMLSFREGGWPRLDRSYLDGERLTHGGFSAKFYKALGLADGAQLPEQMRAAVAAGLQQAIEAAALEMAGSGENLCLAGGLLYNALLVAAFENSGRWKNVFVQPAAGNAGTALGAVFYVWHQICGETARARLGDLCLGPCYGPEEIKEVLENCKLRFRYLLTADELIATAVRELNDNKIVAWMQGRMEFGPRALGNRSILASPLNPYSTENLNVYIKHREPFRKFAASVPAELAHEYFEVGPNARFLATVGRVHPAHRKVFESAILGSDLVRVHTVSREDNPLYWKLLHAFGDATGLPVLYNTSFNLFGDPLVCTPRDAVRSFYSSGVDAMFVGHFLLEK